MSYFGYKALLNIEHGSISCPYVPENLTSAGYTSTLNLMRVIHSMFRMNENIEAYATTEMQSKFPGNYRIEEYFDSTTGKTKLRMVFNSEADEIDFLLKYK